MPRYFVCLIAGMMLAVANIAAAQALPEFEVATIKPTNMQAMHVVGVNVYPGGRVRIGNASLKGLICVAFDLGYWQLSGGESWMEKDEFDLEAVPPEEMRASLTDIRHSYWSIDDERLRQMLQALLIDRFQLKFHRDTKAGTVYLLEKSGKELRLQPTKVDSSGDRPLVPAGHAGEVAFVDARWSLHNASMPELAKFASAYVVRRPVLDQTGLTGSYDYRSPTQVGPDQTKIDLAAAFPLLIEELGLKLKSAKGPVETFVIDHAEKPSSN